MFGLNKPSPAKSVKQVDVTTPSRALDAQTAASKATNADRVVKPGAKAKKAAPKKKGPDNNKRLAQLEAAETNRNAPRSDDPVVLAAFEQGRAARRAAISRDDAPHGDGEAKKQWLKGYDFNG